MMKRTLLVLLLPAVAWSAVDPVAGEAAGKDSAAPATPPAASAVEKADPKLFDEALADYFAQNPRRASFKLFAYLEGSPKTDENRSWAQFFLAKSLLDLGLRHAGASYLARIARERSNPNVLPKALEALRSLTDVPHDEQLIDEQVFGSLDLGFIPEGTGDFARYQQGMVDLRVGNERWAQNHFSRLEERSPEASKARFALLVTRLKDSKDSPKKILDIADKFQELAKDQKLTQEARNEAQMAVARLKYEQKDYEGALAAYREVILPKLDPGTATLYLEEAWARYQLGQIHAALGILTTLDSPSFRDEFQPDKYLLRALIYRDLCHYLPAKRAAKVLYRRFADSLEAIRERQDLTEDLRLRRAAMSHGKTKRAFKFLNSLELEAERIGRYSGSFGDRLVTHLSKMYDLARAEALRTADLELQDSVRQEADRLLRAAEQVRLMDYEVGLKLYERVKRGQKLTAAVAEEPLSLSQVGFRFDGEYWNDELRDYRVKLKSRCIEESAP